MITTLETRRCPIASIYLKTLNGHISNLNNKFHGAKSSAGSMLMSDKENIELKTEHEVKAWITCPFTNRQILQQTKFTRQHEIISKNCFFYTYNDIELRRLYHFHINNHFPLVFQSSRVQLNTCFALRWRHNERDCVSNHQPHDCLLNCLFRCRSMKTSASLAFVRRIHRWPVNSPCKGLIKRKMFPFDDVIMVSYRNIYTA